MRAGAKLCEEFVLKRRHEQSQQGRHGQPQLYSAARCLGGGFWQCHAAVLHAFVHKRLSLCQPGLQEMQRSKCFSGSNMHVRYPAAAFNSYISYLQIAGLLRGTSLQYSMRCTMQ